MNNKNNIYIICGNARSGKTNFANKIKSLSKVISINTGMENLLLNYKTRYVLNSNNHKKHLINYFYSRRFEGKTRNNNLSFSDFFNKEILNEHINKFQFKYFNLSQNIVDFLINFSNKNNLDIFFLDLNFEFEINNYFNRFDNVNILYFTRDIIEILNEVVLFRNIINLDRYEKKIIEKVYFNYYYSKKMIKILRKKNNYNIFNFDFNSISNTNNKDIKKFLNIYDNNIKSLDLIDLIDLIDFTKNEYKNINKQVNAFILNLAEFEKKSFINKLKNFRISFIIKYFILKCIFKINYNYYSFYSLMIISTKSKIKHSCRFFVNFYKDNFFV